MIVPAVYGVFVAVLVVHWFADFVLQTHWQAINKSKSNAALLRHVAVYTAVLAATTCPLFLVWPWPGHAVSWLLFVGLNGFLHFDTKYLTSRWSARLYARGDVNFFVVVGLDQLIHQVTLAVTLAWVLS